MADTRPVISASRRTDIPAFYTPWFMEGIQKGEVTVVNPFNRRERTVDLRPEAVHSIVFWSKNFGPFLAAEAHAALEQMGYRLFFNFTVNAPNPTLEPRIPALDQRLDQVRTLCRKFSPDQINWRFDPICFYGQDGQILNNLEGFDKIARTMADLGISRCITSFYDPYRKVDQRLQAAMAEAGGPRDPVYMEPGAARSEQQDHKKDGQLCWQISRHPAVSLLRTGAKFQRIFPPIENVSASACIDGRLPKKAVQAEDPVTAKDTGQRRDKGCQCTRSVDIGSYDRASLRTTTACSAMPRTGMDTD